MLGLGLGLVYETNLMGGGASFIDTFGQPAIGLSLRDLIGTNPTVLRVRRDSDNAEADFKASEVSNGTLENWVNQTQTLFDENFASSTGWTLRSGATISGGNLNLLNVTNSAEAAYKSFGAIPFQKVLITITVTDYVQGAIYVRNLGGGGDTSPNITANGTYTYEITLGDGNTNWGIGTISGPTTLKVASLKVEQLTANGFVSTWYDQSGNGNDAAQASASSQPKIVSSGSAILENGKVAVQFDGNDNMPNGVGTSTPTNVSVFAVRGISSYPTTFRTLFNYKAFGLTHNANGGVQYGNGAHIFKSLSLTAKSDNYPTTTGQALDTIINQTNLERNSFAATLGDGGTYGLGISGIGSWSGTTQTFLGTIQELVIYESDESANKSGIQTNINDFYTIY